MKSIAWDRMVSMSLSWMYWRSSSVNLNIGNSDKNEFNYQNFLFDISIFTIISVCVFILPAMRFSMIHDFGFT